MTRFIGRCDQLKAEDLHAYDNSESRITARTFRERLGSDLYRYLEIALGYRGAGNGKPYVRGLALATDPLASFGQGLWRGQPCVCCRWSGYHHIYLL